MFNTDAKIIQRMAPMLQRVMVVDPQPAGARLIGELMRDIARSQIWVAETNEKAMRMAGSYDPHIIFAEMGPVPVDGIAFTRELRRSHVAARYAPVIMITGQATAAGILGARQTAGCTNSLRKPFTMKDLLRRLEAGDAAPARLGGGGELRRPRPRRPVPTPATIQGSLKRRAPDAKATPDSERMAQALKILRSAINAIGTDPNQAMRSMQAQVTDLRKCGMSVADLKLTTAAIDFGRYLDEIEKKGAALRRRPARGQGGDAARLHAQGRGGRGLRAARGVAVRALRLPRFWIPGTSPGMTSKGVAAHPKLSPRSCPVQAGGGIWPPQRRSFTSPSTVAIPFPEETVAAAALRVRRAGTGCASRRAAGRRGLRRRRR